MTMCPSPRESYLLLSGWRQGPFGTWSHPAHMGGAEMGIEHAWKAEQKATGDTETRTP